VDDINRLYLAENDEIKMCGSCSRQVSDNTLGGEPTLRGAPIIHETYTQ